MDPSKITGPDKEMREKIDRARGKQERGETLTRAEAGILGAAGAMEKGAREQRAAKRAGELGEYEEEHRTASWMKGEETRAPTLSREDEARERSLRAKEERGEKLTREEAGFLGGVARAREAGKE